MNILEAFGNLDRVSIHHKVDFAPEDAAQINDIKDLIKEINQIIPPMEYPGDNPNNGRPFHTFTVGREYSRVVYVNVVKAYRKDIDFKNLGDKFFEIGEKFGADENWEHENSNGIFIWRYWFD